MKEKTNPFTYSSLLGCTTGVLLAERNQSITTPPTLSRKRGTNAPACSLVRAGVCRVKSFIVTAGTQLVLGPPEGPRLTSLL
jgi:hypothetical protein